MAPTWHDLRLMTSMQADSGWLRTAPCVLVQPSLLKQVT